MTTVHMAPIQRSKVRLLDTNSGLPECYMMDQCTSWHIHQREHPWCNQWCSSRVWWLSTEAESCPQLLQPLPVPSPRSCSETHNTEQYISLYYYYYYYIWSHCQCRVMSVNTTMESLQAKHDHPRKCLYQYISVALKVGMYTNVVVD